jgi:hypothetical protein
MTSRQKRQQLLAWKLRCVRGAQGTVGHFYSTDVRDLKIPPHIVNMAGHINTLLKHLEGLIEEELKLMKKETAEI